MKDLRFSGLIPQLRFRPCSIIAKNTSTTCQLDDFGKFWFPEEDSNRLLDVQSVLS